MPRFAFVLIFIFISILTLIAQDNFRKDKEAFNNAIRKKDPVLLENAICKIVKYNSQNAAKLLLKSLAKVKEDNLYWLIIKGLACFTEETALEEIAKFILSRKGKPISRDVMYALQCNTSENVITVLEKIIARGTYDLKIMAINHLAKIGTKDTIQPLITALKAAKTDEIKRQAHRALRIVTGKDCGSKWKDWQNWWDANKNSFVPPKERKRKKTGTAADYLDRTRVHDYEDITKIDKRAIVVIKGCYDKIREVLEKMKIPHTVISKSSFVNYDLSKCMALLINCDNYMETPNARMSDKGIKKIRDFVSKGGYLFTSDWGLTEILERAFPKYVWEAVDIPEEDVVSLLPEKGALGHPFMKEVFTKYKGKKEATATERSFEKIDHQWLIDPVSYAIGYDKKKVLILVKSKQLEDKFGYGAVAVTFCYGENEKLEKKGISTQGSYQELSKLKGGKVLHVLSHFARQKKKDDEYALQNMLLNFLIEAHTRRKLKKKP